MEVKLLQFVDDTLIMCDSNIQNICVVKPMLRFFEICYGFRINFFKSKISALGLDINVLKMFSEVLHCSIMNIQFVYLGLPIGGNPSKAYFWDPMITKVKKRLPTWKGKHISFVGCVCMICSVLNAIPLYYLSFFKAPPSICKKITKLQRKFLWGWDSEGRKIVWIKWDNICKSRRSNLEIRSGQQMAMERSANL